MTMREIIGTIGIFKFAILMLASTFWIVIDGIPYVPLGLIIIVYYLGKQKLKVYAPFVLMTIIGFTGIGLYVHSYTETRQMVKTGETFKVHKFYFGFGTCTNRLRALLNDGKIVIFDDSKYTKEVKIAQLYVEAFEKSYREHNSTFMENTFVYQRGITKEKITAIFDKMQKEAGNLNSSAYLGYIYWVYPPKMNHKEITLVYKTEFERNSKFFNTLQYRFVLDKNATKLIRFSSRNNSVKYKVKK